MKWLIATVLSALNGLLLTEGKAWVSRSAHPLLRFAVARLPRAYRPRLHEEWSATLEEYADRSLSRLAAAMGFVLPRCKSGMHHAFRTFRSQLQSSSGLSTSR